MGRDEDDVTVEPDEKPETCDDLLCDVSIKSPRKLKASAPSGLTRVGGQEGVAGAGRDGLEKEGVVPTLNQDKSTCAKCCPKRPGALHRLLTETRVERDDVSHRDCNRALETQY